MPTDIEPTRKTKDKDRGRSLNEAAKAFDG
jgi:hypothetical protein